MKGKEYQHNILNVLLDKILIIIIVIEFMSLAWIASLNSRFISGELLIFPLGIKQAPHF